MTRGTVQRFTLLGTLYFAQGLPFGFFVQALPVLLRKAHYSLSAIGLATLLSAPWAMKFLWAPYVDTHYSSRLGRRRTWILAMQAAGTLVLAGITVMPGTESLGALMAAMVVLNFIAATQDIATDGLAVEVLTPDERGRANGLQVAAYRVGMIVGGGALLGLYDVIGHRGVFAVMTALTALSSVPVMFAREPATVTAAAARVHAAPRVPHWLRLPGVWRVLAVVVAYKLGESAAQGMLKPFLVDRGLDLEDIAWISGTISAGAGMTGAMVGGWAVARLGRLRALVAFGIAQVVTVVGYAYLALGQPSYTELCVWAGVEHLASGAATASLFTAMMDWSRPEASGTDYTVQASAVVITTGITSALGGVSAQLLGYGAHFALSAVLCALAIVIVVRCFPRDGFPRAAGPALRA